LKGRKIGELEKKKNENGEASPRHGGGREPENQNQREKRKALPERHGRRRR